MILNIKIDPLHTAENNWLWFENSCPKHTCVCAQSLQSCPTLCDTSDCSPPGSSVHGILQSRTLEWVAMPSSRVSSQPRDWTCISCSSCIAGGFFTAEPPEKPKYTWVNSWWIGFPGGAMVKNSPDNAGDTEMWVQSLGLEDALEKEMASHSSILAWGIPWTKESCKLQSMGLQRVGHDCTHTYKLIITPCFRNNVNAFHRHCLNLS